MAKKKQIVEETHPVEELVQETVNEVIEENATPEVKEEVVEEVEENDTIIDEEPVDAQQVMEEFNEKAKELDSFVTNTTTQEELSEKLENELERVENVEKQLKDKISKLEKQITPEAKNGFAKFWMGASDGWFN